VCEKTNSLDFFSCLISEKSMSFVFSCLFGCLAPKQKPGFQTKSRELENIQTQLERAGSHTTACTNSRSTSFGPKQSLNHKLTNLQRTEQHIKDMDKHPMSDDDLSKQSLDKLPEDTTKDACKTHSRSESSKISAQTIQLDYITVDYKPKNTTVITRSLPQFEPERKSRFASVSLNADLKKSQSTKTDNKLVKSTKSQTKIPKPEKKDPKLKMSKSGTLGRKKTTANKYRY